MIASQCLELSPGRSFEANCTLFFALISFHERPDTESWFWWSSWNELVLFSSCSACPDTKTGVWWCSWNKWACCTFSHRRFSILSKFYYVLFNFNLFFIAWISFLYPVILPDGASERACPPGNPGYTEICTLFDTPPTGLLGRWLVRDRLESLK